MAPSSLAMLKRLARKPSIASLTPAITKAVKATSIWLEAIAQTTIGTSRMRPRVMIFGILTRRFPATRPYDSAKPAPGNAEPVVIYIVHASPACEPLRGGEIRRNPAENLLDSP